MWNCGAGWSTPQFHMVGIHEGSGPGQLRLQGLVDARFVVRPAGQAGPDEGQRPRQLHRRQATQAHALLDHELRQQAQFGRCFGRFGRLHGRTGGGSKDRCGRIVHGHAAAATLSGRDRPASLLQ